MSNSIWKTRDEEPKKYPILALGDDGKYYVFESPKLGTGDLGWKHRCHDYVKQYCYLDDLIAQADKAERLQKAVIWLIGGDTGISSKTMCAALFGLIPKDSDMPHDAGDFGRCLRFIRFMPDGTKDIVFKKLSDKPEWVEIGKRWDELVDLYDQENWAGIGDILRAIRKECRQPRPNEIFIGL